jgi:hypothetical protein
VHGDEGLLRRIWRGVANLLPTGGIGDDGPPPDVDGRRDTDAATRQAVLRAKSQQTPGGMGTTSFEPDERPPKRDA